MFGMWKNRGERPTAKRPVETATGDDKSFIHEETNTSIFGDPKPEVIEIPQGAYAASPELDKMTKAAMRSIETASGEPAFEGMKVEKLRKMDTLAMRAHLANSELRFRPGSRLRTYKVEGGAIVDETYGGKAIVGEGHTIYRNTEPLTYPSTWPVAALRGTPIMGDYDTDGTFHEDPHGKDTLYNEYVTDDAEHPMRKYGITPVTREWTKGVAQIPSYLIEIPESVGKTAVRAGDKIVSVGPGDFVVVEVLGKGKIGVQAIQRDLKERTYGPW